MRQYCQPPRKHPYHRRVRQRGQLVVRLHRHHHHHRHQSQPQLGALVSDRDPSVLIARQLSPLPESEQTLSDHRPSQHHRVVTVASLGGNSLINTETLRRQEWYLRKCYAKELRIIQGKGPSTNTMEDRAARVGTPASFADGPVVTGGTEERAPSRVRVHFFESGAVKCPSATGGSSAAMDVSVDGQLFNGNASNSYFRETQQTQQHVFTTSTPNGTSVRTVTYTARQSTDSGIDNPFRPEGELSLEADEIVKAIKEGRPIDSIDSGRISRQELGTTTLSINTSAVPENKSPTNVKNGAAKNGSAKGPSNKKL
ncbi:uncharacterized protein LOC111262136 isoform X2 [Varroa jacobsoni]|uniref:Uncharacterized protein n=1 Tax=Varroa destructor TaxID=109461 RepID=A0A7M7K1P5_VARDE|nr:uncharacterized protein LOC111250007 isoform X2 [Varroa destructor]XP_022691898.1 uncharacterized protein LOC111262136 isoform X2 [Varroa jacobsoni]